MKQFITVVHVCLVFHVWKYLLLYRRICEYIILVLQFNYTIFPRALITPIVATISGSMHSATGVSSLMLQTNTFFAKVLH